MTDDRLLALSRVTLERLREQQWGVVAHGLPMNDYSAFYTDAFMYEHHAMLAQAKARSGLCEFCSRLVSACDLDIYYGCGTTQAGETQEEKRARVEREKAQTWRDQPGML